MSESDNLKRKDEVTARLAHHVRKLPHLIEHIYRELLILLHRRGIASIDTIQDEVRVRLGQESVEASTDPNLAERDRWDEAERQLVESVTREYAREHLSLLDIDDLINLIIKREEVQSLDNVTNRPNVTFRELADQVQRFCELPLGETLLPPAEVLGTRVALTRHLLSDQLEFIGIAKNHLMIRDFDDITRRIVGSDDAMGRIGGKAGGMILAHRILANAEENKDPFLPVAMPESYYLRSDVVLDFLRLNRLDEYQSQKYKDVDDLTREYPLIRGVFRNGDFPLKIIHGLRKILENIGLHPLIVRSSSLLEDRFGTAFSGKYASFFLANQGSLEQRLRALLGAIAEVYASVLSPDPIVYRREHHLLDYVEEMAVLIQKVVGVKIGNYFLPSFAGVAFSRNEYRWSPRIKRDDGLVRLVMGLGTRAVDRSGPEYPRMVALGAPTLRTESTVQEIKRYAQQTLDVIDLKKNRLRSVRCHDVLEQSMDIAMLDRIVSVQRDSELYAPAGHYIDADPADLYITFDKLLRATPFAQRVRDMLSTLEDAYGAPVDMEFASDGQHFYVLQCRTQSQALDAGTVEIPEDIPEDKIIFNAQRYVRTGLVHGIAHIVYVDPSAYDAIPTRQRRVALARLIGRINHKLQRRSFILVGPGRWGSNDVGLGVPVRYADINHCRMLIEVARDRNGFVPEVSFGTHFFQDLVEADIHYLPLYPDITPNRFNEEFLLRSHNCLKEIAPDDSDFEDLLHVIDIPRIADGATLSIAMDGESDRAVAWLNKA